MLRPERIIRAANMQKGIDSLSLMPLQFAGDAVGSIASRFGLNLAPKGKKLGKHLVGRHIVNPAENFSHRAGDVLSELPGIGKMFKYKVSPADVAEATVKKRNIFQRMAGKDAPYGKIETTAKEFENLSRMASDGKLTTNRMTAPFESKGMYTFVLPILAGMHVQDQFDKEPTEEQKEKELSDSRNKQMYNQFRESIGLNQGARNENMSNPSEMMKQAADCIDDLNGKVQSLNQYNNLLKQEIEMYKKASHLASIGSIPVESIVEYVESGAQDIVESQEKTAGFNPDLGNEYSILDIYKSTQGSIPKHAQSIGQLHEQDQVKKYRLGGHSQEKSIARQQFNEFLLS